MKPPEGMMAIPLDDVLRKLVDLFVRGAKPNPGMAPTFGSEENPASFTFMTCTDNKHVCHAYIDVGPDDGHAPIFCSQEYDGSWEVENELTLQNNLAAAFGVAGEYGFQVQGLIDNPGDLPIYTGKENNGRDDNDLPGFYL